MRIPHIATALALAVLVALPAAAAEEKAKKKRGGQRLNAVSQVMLRLDRLRRAIEELDLTAEQEQKLAENREKHRPKMEEMWEGIQDMLTKDQRSAGEEAMRSARDAGKEGREFFVEVESAVKLTDEQKQKMEKIAKELHPMVREMTKSVMGVLTPEQQEVFKKKTAPQRKAGAARDKKKKEK